MIINDFRTAYRSLRRSPLFVVVATLTLGIGIGLTTTMLSLLDAIRHPYVPYRNPEQLFSVTAFGGGTSGQVGEYEKRWAMIDGTKSFEGVASAASRYQGQISVEGRTFLGDVSWVTDNYFTLLGAEPELGRVFGPAPTGSADDGAVIGFGLWRRAFSSQPLHRGLSVTVGDQTYSVIGVMPPDMRGGGAYLRYGAVWLKAQGTTSRTGVPIVRLREGVTLQGAYAELAVVAARLKQTYGEGKQPFQFRLDPLQPPPRELRDYHKAMGGAAIVILLIACANLANLMLVRGLSRRKELSLRLALGAGRGALIRQLLTESSMVGILGGVAGTVLTVWGIGAIRHAMPAEGTAFGFVPPHLSWMVYAFAVLATIGSVILFGLGPSIAASSVQLSEPLKETLGTTTGRSRRWYTLIVVAEVALCLVLLMGSGLLLRAAGRVAAFDFGFDESGLIATQMRLQPRIVANDSAVPAVYRSVLERVARIPGVTLVTTSTSATNRGSALTSDLEGPMQRFTIARVHRVVSWNFLRTLGVTVIAGRDFEPGDEEATAPVAIVGEQAAAALWPGVNPVGRMLKLGNPNAAGDWVRVVGVARQFSLSFQDDPAMSDYPMALVVRPGDLSRLREVVVRMTGDETGVAERLATELQASVPGGPFIGGVQRFMAGWEGQREARNLLARLFGVFGLLALGLGAIGLYGVLAYSVGQRMREFGVRIALGARPRDLKTLVLRDAAVMILGGTAIGAWLAMSGAYFLELWLFNVPPTDAVSLIGAEAVLLVVAFVACLAPARRATQADPLQIIRAQ